MKSPVLFIVFNRPQTTREVFQAIRASRPPRLYVAADGPRTGVANEHARCEQVRDIARRVDWPCELSTRFMETNLGCKRGVSDAINWFFQHEGEGIILEDDVLPAAGFFEYCDELLERFRYDTHIGIVSGCNLVASNYRATSSYFFSRYAHVWGWATWKRTWQLYDVEMTDWPTWRDDNKLSEVFAKNVLQQTYWRGIFDRVYEGEIDTWDYQLAFMCWRNGLLSIIPSHNLTLNIGFGTGATHTSGNAPAWLRKSVPKPMTFPLDHPDGVEHAVQADDQIWRRVFRQRIGSRMRIKLTSFRKRLFKQGEGHAR